MSVKVAIRVRPFNEREKFLGCLCCVEMKDNTTVVYENRGKDKKQHFFTFDYSFWSHDGFKEDESGKFIPTENHYMDQMGVYKLLGQQILQNAWVGFNCCLFAYGQTGAGKSYSMIGYGANKGIIPMACEELFARIKRFQRKGEREYEVTISMLEIYNEKVQDLLISTNKRSANGLKIRQNKALGVYVEGLNKFPVTSYREIEKKMEEGSKNRSLASTLMNQYSSRAHTIVMLEFIQKEWVTKNKMSKKSSLINLVDLAGSERVGKTGVGDNKDRLKEASLINKSLHTLGRCIEALAELSHGKAKTIAVPYRDSALTRILENALGGNSKTTMICAISPANDNYEETLSTLRYADKTKKIKNKPIVNESEVDKLIRELRSENERLKKMLETPTPQQQAVLQSPSKGLSSSSISNANGKEAKSNLKASIRQIEREIRKNMQSFAINTETIEEDLLGEDSSMMMTEYVDLQDPSLLEDFGDNQFLTTSENSVLKAPTKIQAYITNLNEDKMLNYKVKYSCDTGLIVVNNSRSDKQLPGDSGTKRQTQRRLFDKGEQQSADGQQAEEKKVVLCGLGIEERHARITRHTGNRYFIEALTEQSQEYTLLNGKPLYSKKQLYHNDRIILGINTIFLFKSNIDPTERKDRIYKNERELGYEFALNERQEELEDDSLLLGLNSSRIRPFTLRDGDDSLILEAHSEDKELKSKLQEIENQFAKMMEENERKIKEKEERYRQRLQELQLQQELKDLEKQDLEEKLKAKKEQTYRLRSKELQIEKLNKRLAKFEKEKEKRKLYRESLLLEDSQAPVFEGSLEQAHNSAQGDIGIEKIVSKEQFRPQIKLNNSNQAGKSNNFPKQTQNYEEVLLEEYDYESSDKTDKTLLTTQANITNVTALNGKDNLFDEEAEIERYNKFTKEYIASVKANMHLFAKQYDIRIESQVKVALANQSVVTVSVSTETIAPDAEKIGDTNRGNLKWYCDKCSNELINGKNMVPSSYKDQKSIEVEELVESAEVKDGSNRGSRNSKEQSSLSDDTLLLNGFQHSSEGQPENCRARLSSIDSSNEAKRTKSQSKLPEIVEEDSIKESPTKNAENGDTQPKSNLFGNRNQKTEGVQTQMNQKSMLELYIPMEDYRADIEDEENQRRHSQILPDLKSTQNQEAYDSKASAKNNILEVDNHTVSQDATSQKRQRTEDSSKNNKPRSKNQQKSQSPTERLSSAITVDFDLSVSDIEDAENDLTLQNSLNFSSLNTFREQELNSQIEELKKQIKQLQTQNQSRKVEKAQKEEKQSFDADHAQKPLGKQSTEKQRKSKVMKTDGDNQNSEVIQKVEDGERNSTQQAQSKQCGQVVSAPKKFASLPSQFSQKDFLKKNSDIDPILEKQLQNNLIQCNNENIISERKLNLRKKKRESEELKKALFKKEKIELQKQLHVLIPMVERFNRIAKQMRRLIEGKIQIQYRNFSHYDIIEALKNLTKSKFSRGPNPAGYSNVQIKIAIANLEEARVYKWSLEVFKNRFEIAEEIFQKYIQNGEDENEQKSLEKDKNKDPFWDPLQFISNGSAYVSMECLLYDIGYEGYVSFVHNTKLIAKAYVNLSPVKAPSRKNVEGTEMSESSLLSAQPERPDSSMEIINPRSFLQSSLFFTLSIQTIEFMEPVRESSSAPLRFQIEYELLVDDYRNESYSTPETEFRSYGEEHEMHYLRRHAFREVSESTLAYVSDCPIRLTLKVMKDYNQECLNSSFNQDLNSSVNHDEESQSQNSSILSNVRSHFPSRTEDPSSQSQILSLDGSVLTRKYQNSLSGPEKEFKQNQFSSGQKLNSQKQRPSLVNADFTKKKNEKSLFYENTEMMSQINRQYQTEEQRRLKEKKRRVEEMESKLRPKKQSLKKQEKECTIY